MVRAGSAGLVAGDTAAAAIGLGAIADGDGFISLGTSAQYFVAAGRHRPHPETYVHAFAHALPDRWFQTAAILNGAGLLGWVSRLLGTPIETLLGEAEAAYEGPSFLTTLPYLAGERTPHNDPLAKGVIYGLTPGATRAEIVQSALEAVAFALADGQDALAKAETFATHLAVTGGGARSLFWMRILANVLDRRLIVHGGSAFGPALGAARLLDEGTAGKRLPQAGQGHCRRTGSAPGRGLSRETAKLPPSLCRAARCVSQLVSRIRSSHLLLPRALSGISGKNGLAR